jgi:hypothetical protein
LKNKLNHFELKCSGLEQDKVRFKMEEKKHFKLIEEHQQLILVKEALEKNLALKTRGHLESESKLREIRQECLGFRSPLTELNATERAAEGSI